ncbi:hypothetical protein EXS74_00120 [Candidatus Woesearchaeota archaeon]|nr:hypothetical protein [Candidatus Woesearchaeota archaeon]
MTDNKVLDEVVHQMRTGGDIPALKQKLRTDGMTPMAIKLLMGKAEVHLQSEDLVLGKRLVPSSDGSRAMQIAVYHVHPREVHTDPDGPQVVDNGLLALGGSDRVQDAPTYQRDTIVVGSTGRVDVLPGASGATDNEPLPALAEEDPAAPLPYVPKEPKVVKESPLPFTSVPKRSPSPSYLPTGIILGTRLAIQGAAIIGCGVVTSFLNYNASHKPEPIVAESPLPLPETRVHIEEPLPEMTELPISVAGKSQKIFTYENNTLTIRPIKGLGLANYAAVIAQNDSLENLAAMSLSWQESKLRATQRDLPHATKVELRKVLGLVEVIAEQNPDDVYKERLTLKGLKDPTRNVIYAEVPLELTIEQTQVAQAPVEGPIVKSAEPKDKDTARGVLAEAILPSRRRKEDEDERIFTYNLNDGADPSDDTLSIKFVLPGVGTSQYIAAMIENGWNREALYDLAQWLASEQVSLVVSANTTHIRSLDRDKVAPIIDLTRDVLDANLDHKKNPSPLVHRADFSPEGMKDGKRNVVYRADTLVVAAPKEFISTPLPQEVQESLERIVHDNFESTELPGLGRITQEYFELRQIERDLPFVEDPLLMGDVILNVARQYNQTQDSGEPTSNSIDPSVVREERLELARDLYMKAGERRDRETYMTVKEIIRFVNEGLDEKITAQDLKTDSLPDTREGMLHREMQDRRFDVWERSLQYGLGKPKAELVRSLAAVYGVSTSTIYKDLREVNREAPEARNIIYS